jgi:hypothetical protein
MNPTYAQELAVLQSVTYAALFDYPLTLPQLCESLVGERADGPTIARWLATGPLLQATIQRQNGLYFPAGRSDLPATRRRREALSRYLLEHDRKVLQFLAAMPFVRLVAVSGSLAHLNAEGESDLDLFVITRPGRVWLVTLVALIVSRMLGWRRRLCLNYIVSEANLAIEPDDLFSANQIIHLRPVIGQEVYRRFLEANAFVRRYYPNFMPREMNASPWRLRRWRGINAIEAVLNIGVAPVAERISRALYSWYLRRQSSRWQSRDQVRLDPECLKLHTSSHRGTTMARFNAALAEALRVAKIKQRLIG